MTAETRRWFEEIMEANEHAGQEPPKPPGPRLIAFVAIKRHRSEGGATFAYLPNTDIQLPSGWEWSVIDGQNDTEDVTDMLPGSSLEETCRMMCAHAPEITF